MIGLRRALLICCAALGGCATGIQPHTPRVAQAPGYRIVLERSRNAGIADPSMGAQLVELRVDAIPRGARVVWAGVSRAGLEACKTGVAAERMQVRGSTQELAPATPRPGDILELGLSLQAWQFALGGPSRLDLLIEEPNGQLKCAAFALVGEAPAQRWDSPVSWTLETNLAFEFFTHQVDGLESLVSFGAGVGKWLGPVRVQLASGAGVSECPRDTCPAMKGDENSVRSEKYYVPLLAGVGGTLLQLGPVALEGNFHYRVGWTAADTYTGLKRSFLHGPVLTPSLMVTVPNPIAPGIPGGTRRGLGLGGQAPLAYVMSAHGASSFSVGGVLVFLFPLR